MYVVAFHIFVTILIVLQVINPALNTVPYAYILLANYSALAKGNKSINPDELWLKMANFLGNFDARQIRYLGVEYTRIVEIVALYARRQRQVCHSGQICKELHC